MAGPPAARHHEPFAWCVDILWAVSDFTEENGGTTIVPRSHSWLRQAGRTDRGQDGHPTPWSAPNGRAKYTVPPEQVTHRKGLLCPPLCKSPDSRESLSSVHQKVRSALPIALSGAPVCDAEGVRAALQRRGAAQRRQERHAGRAALAWGDTVISTETDSNESEITV